jgi:hypothetical protein
LDVFATMFTDTPDGQVYAFLAPADPTQAWTAVQVDPGPIFSAHGTTAGVFDRTGDVEFAVGETNYGGWNFGLNPDPKVNVYRLTGADPTNPASWDKTRVDVMGGHELRAADLTGDGLDELIWTGTTLITSSYQWQRCDSSGANCSPINGATSVSYTVASADSGHTLRVVAKATNVLGNLSATSNPTALVP